MVKEKEIGREKEKEWERERRGLLITKNVGNLRE